MTHTVATLEVSPATYDEIRKALEDAGYVGALADGTIDMTGVALVERSESPATSREDGSPLTSHRPHAKQDGNPFRSAN